MKPETIILVDLDNLTSHDEVLKVLSFYTPQTKFVFFAIGTDDPKKRKADQRLTTNCGKIRRIRDMFHFHKDQMELVFAEDVLPDASDMNMFAYVGKNIPYWIIDDVQNVLVASGDKGVFNLAIMLNQHFNTWMVHSQRQKLCSFDIARKLGLTVPRIMLKY